MTKKNYITNSNPIKINLLVNNCPFLPQQEQTSEMEERKRQKFRLRRPEGSAYDVRTRASRLRATSLAVNRSGHGYSSCMVKTPLVFLCVCVIWHQISLDLPSVNAFSVFRPESITPTLPSLSSSRPEASPTCLFLFSLRNDNNEGEEPGSENDDGSTATIERAAGWNAEEESEDFSAWMEGLRKGTPLGKMASQAAVENKDASDPKIIRSSSTKKEVVNSVSLRERKQDRSVSMDNNTGRRKINPLSNLIQFEAMLELAKIAGNKDTKIDMDADGTIANSNSTSATDVFAVVDRLVKTFQKQEENRQTEGKELLQLAQLEETIAKEQEEIEANPEDVSATTTVKDLMELDRYVGGIEFPKVSNIWDSFGSKTEEAVTTEEDEQVGGTDKNSIPSPTGSASSSPLFRGNELSDADAASSPSNLARAAESILKDTTNKMEYLVAEASSSTLEPSDGDNSSSSSTSALQDLVGRASSVFNNTSASTASATTGTIVESISNDIVSAAQKIAKESGVDINVQFAADRAREATEYAIGVTTTANMILDAGYAYGSRSGAAGMSIRDDNFNYLAASAATQTAGSVFSDGSSSSTAEAPAHQPPLFGDFASAQRIEPHEYENVVFQGADMGVLAGAIYENAAHRCHKLGHSLVANGTTADVAWMVTDSVMDRERFKAAFRHHDDAIDSNEDESEDASSSGPVMVRTITMRGFDASDESVDREALLNEICFATSVPMDEATADKVVFHKGLLEIARQIYSETKKYIDWTSPNHKIILNGHSVGGSLSVLMLLLIASERGCKLLFAMR